MAWFWTQLLMQDKSSITFRHPERVDAKSWLDYKNDFLFTIIIGTHLMSFVRFKLLRQTVNVKDKKKRNG